MMMKPLVPSKFLRSRPRLLAALVSSCLAAAVPTAAFAQSYPNKAITFVVPAAPGGILDQAARLVASELTKVVNQPVVVENRVGAAGTIGTASVARAPADGYTLLFGSASSLTVGPALYKNLTYDTNKSFSPIIQMLRGAFILTVRSELPVNDVKELVLYAKDRPGKLTYGSSGNGSLHHLCMEMFKSAALVDITHVPFGGSPPNWLAFNRGEIDMICDSMPNPIPTLQSGKGRAIAVTGDLRADIVPKALTFREQGFPSVNMDFWYGFLAPAGTPTDVVNKLNLEIAAVLRDPEIVSRYKAQSIDIVAGKPEEFGRLLAAESKMWPPIVSKANAKVD
jgi:tripartite-type tricarboxylate transporter receptor subunit TctC